MTKTQRWLPRYGIAVLAVAAAAAVVLTPELGKGAATVPFFAVLISVRYGGLGPAVFAIALTTVLAVVIPAYRGDTFPPWRFLQIGLFVAGGALITLLVEALHAARRRAEESRRWLSAVLTSIGDGVIATDGRGRITFTNPIARALTGWEDHEAAGRPLEEVLHVISEETGKVVENPVARVIREGIILGLANHVVLIARDGTERPIADSAAPIRGDSGEVEGAVLVFRDVTDQKRAEDALRASEDRFRLTADSAPVLIWLADPDQLCYWFNKPWLTFTGRTMDQTLGDGWLEDVHPDDVDRCLSVFSDAFETRQPFKREYRLRRHDGEYRWVIDNGIPLYGSGGAFTGYIGSCVDITDRRLAEDELREADRRKDEFLAMLAHELRNPLSAIGNAVELAKRGGWQGTEEWAQGVLERQVRHLARLIDDLLDVSRVSRGKIQLRTEILDLRVVLDAAVATVRPLVDERGHALDVRAPGNALWVKGDPTRLEQVVVNLLTNAVKYTEPGGRITLAADRQGDTVVISVSDTGVGIPPEQLPRMFDLFAQGDRSLARSEGGLGIGLTLVRTLTEMHGGHVTARSEGRGRGSEFSVHLPAAEAPQIRPESSPKPHEQPCDKASCRILVVDDNVDTARGMGRLLKRLGHDVRIAHDGPSAVEAAGEQRPEFVLLDIGLPGMDGYEVARRLRDEGLDEAVIIAVSGYGRPEDRRQSRNAGIDYHLVKPVDHDVLLRLIGLGVQRPSASESA